MRTVLWRSENTSDLIEITNTKIYQLICNEDIFLSCDPETPAENFNSGNDIIRFYKDFNLGIHKTLFIYRQSRDSVNVY